MISTQHLPQTGFIRKPVVLAHVPFGPTKLQELVKSHDFPAPVKFGSRMVAWRAEEVRAWIEKQGQPVAEAA